MCLLVITITGEFVTPKDKAKLPDLDDAAIEYTYTVMIGGKTST